MLFLKPLHVPVLEFLMGKKLLLVFLAHYYFYVAYLPYWCMKESKGNVCQKTTNVFFLPHEPKQFSELKNFFFSSDDFLKGYPSFSV